MLSIKGSVDARITWKPSRWSIPLVRWKLPLGRLTGGSVRPELTFSLVLTPRIVTDWFDKGKGPGKKDAWQRFFCFTGRASREAQDRRSRLVIAQIPTIGRRCLSSFYRAASRVCQGLSPGLARKCSEKTPRYNRLKGTCAHQLRGLSPRCHLAFNPGGCLYPKFKSMKNIAFFYW